MKKQTESERDNDLTVYTVPVTAFGMVDVAASSAEDAAEAAVSNVDAGDLRVQRGYHGACRASQVQKNANTPMTEAINTSDPGEPVTVPNPPTLADLKRARRELGLAVHDIADELGLEESQVLAWEDRREDMSKLEADMYRQALERLNGWQD